MSLAKIQKFLIGAQVPVININGLITSKTTENVAQSLKKINTNTSKAVAVVINSSGGQLHQSDIIGQKIKIFCQKHKLPFYTFAGDICASSGYFLLAMGDKAFADKSSLVGSINVVATHTGLKRFIEQQKIENRDWQTQDKLLESIGSKSLGEVERKYLLELTQNQSVLLKEHVLKYRGAKLSEQADQSEIFNGELYLGSKAKELGLIDDVQDLASAMYEQYPTATFDFVQNKATFKDVKQRFQHMSFGVKIYDKTSENGFYSQQHASQNLNALNNFKI